MRSTLLSLVPAKHDLDGRAGAPVLRVDRRSKLDRKELLHDYVLKERPVILTDAVESWPAMGKWTPGFFKTHYGQLEKMIAGRSVTLAEQMDRIHCSTPQNPAPYPYNLEVEDHFPELMSDLGPQLLFGRSDRGTSPWMPQALLNGTPIHEVFFGGNGSFFPFVHFDALYLHTQLTQIHGEKELVLYAPEDAAYLYPYPDNKKYSQVSNVFEPDLDRFPLLAKATPYKEVLHEGETIFFPCGWWHTTITHRPSITYGRVVLNSTNFGRYLTDKYPRWVNSGGRLKANAAYALGKVVGGVMSTMERFS